MTGLDIFEPNELADLDGSARRCGIHEMVPVVVNGWKRTATLRGSTEAGGDVVLKWRSPAASARVVAWFEAERRAYRSGPYPSLRPTLLDDDERWLLLAAIPGRGVLDALEHALIRPTGTVATPTDITRRWLATMCDAYRSTLGSTRSTRPRDAMDQDRLDAAGVALDVIHRSLSRSGPMRMRRTYGDALVGRMVAGLTRTSVRRLLTRHPGLATQGWAHGDLHLDNLWLAADGRVLMLDLATSDPNGFPALDLVYGLAATLARLGGHSRERTSTEAAARETLAELGPVGADVLAMSEALARVATTNRRFAPDLGLAQRLLACGVGTVHLTIDARRP